MRPLELVVIFRRPRVAAPSSVAAAAQSEGVQAALRRFNVALRPLFDLGPVQLAVSDANTGAMAELLGEQARYYVGTITPERADELLAQLRNNEAVESAYVKPPVSNPIAPPNAMFAAPASPLPIPDYTGQQGYLDPAPAGVDARAAWGLPGGKGKDVAVIDIEGGWQFSHVDLRQNLGGLAGGTVYPEIYWRDHGTAVLGEMGGDDNRFGVCGICPDAILSAVSHGSLGSAGAIHLAAQKLRPGDLMLLEMHRPGPRYNYADSDDQLGFIAVEWWADDYLAIRFATLKGIIVVSAAGNGSEDLDDPIYDPNPGFPSTWSNPFRRGAHDSGSVIVGAGAPPSGAAGPDRSRLSFSNYGDCVDCQGWGRGVVTTGYGDLFRNVTDLNNEDYFFTANFSGTSSASPIVTGALACLQGILKAKGKKPLSPSASRNLLRTTGSPQQGNTSERIGNRPDLAAMIATVKP